MLTGLPPFYSEDVQHMYTKIMTAELEIPDTMSPEAADLLSKLLDRDPETRLQVRKVTSSSSESHSSFRSQQTSRGIPSLPRLTSSC